MTVSRKHAYLKLLALVERRLMARETHTLVFDELPSSDKDELAGRYLVVRRTEYYNKHDTTLFDLCDTLDSCQAEVEEHLFQRAGVGYNFYADVYDMEAGTKLEYDVIEEIRWNETKNYGGTT